MVNLKVFFLKIWLNILCCFMIIINLKFMCCGLIFILKKKVRLMNKLIVCVIL